MDNDVKTYDIENIPDDMEVKTKKAEFDPIDPSETYQVQVELVQLKDNPFYRPDEEKEADKGSKYQFSFAFVILDEGDFYGRWLWDNTGLSFKPNIGGTRGPTKLYKIVSAALNKEFTWEECEELAPDMKSFYKNLLEQVRGKQIKVGIENVKREDGSVRTKIKTYHSVKKQLPEYDPDGDGGKSKKKRQNEDEKIDVDDIPF